METEAQEAQEQQAEAPEDNFISQDEAQSILNYDPFAHLEAEEDASPSQEEPQEPAEEEAQEEEAPEEPKAAAEPAQPDLARELQELRAQLTQQRTAPTPPPKEEKKEEKLPDYLYDIKPEVVEALGSEDPLMRTQALQAIVQGTARAVHQSLREEYRQYTQQVVENYVQRHTQETTRAQSIESDFYGRHKDLNTPLGRSLVGTVAQEVIRESGGDQPYTAQLGDKIAERVRQYARQLAGGQSGPQEKAAGGGAVQNKQPQKQKKPAVQTKPGTRPSVPSQSDTAADVQSTLF